MGENLILVELKAEGQASVEKEILKVAGAIDTVGKEFENLIYLDLKRQGKEVFYYKTKSGYEVDFVVTSKNEKPKLIQVAWDINDPETLEREERALRDAEKELGISGEIIDLQSYLRALKE